MKAIETVVPFFPGFYHSYLSDMVDNEIEYYLDDEDNTETYDDIEDRLDYQKAYKEISKQWLNKFNNITGLNLEYIEIDSPREYNFTTDRLIARISSEELNPLKNIPKTEPETFQRVLNRHFKSYDGFCSFYSNDIDDWDKDMDELDCNEVMAYIEAYILTEGLDEDDIIDQTIDSSCVYEAAQYVWK
jgi:hypothetical protein